jgi:hypothetical protein
MAGARWIIIAGDRILAGEAGPLPTGRALRILKEGRKRRSIVGQVRLIPVDPGIQPIDVDQAIADLDARPVGS